ncbi:MAG: DNA repair protein RecO [Candidatus Krumholzibacteriota bacterium]|nr:DNA repair protein RecO [Candidatus Krumholzibacteriota bacterium]
MSEIIRDRLVILRTFDYGESSVIAVSLTRFHGKLRFLARGAKKAKSPFYGNLRTGNTGEAVFYIKSQRGLQTLKEIDTSSVFDAGGNDLDRLCIFQAGLEVVDRSTIEDEYDERFFDLLEGFITTLNRSPDPWALFFSMEVQILCMAGIYPSIRECSGCKRLLAGKGLNIDPLSGSVYCKSCSGEGSLHLSAQSAGLLAEMESNGTDLSAQMEIGPAGRREIGRLLHGIFVHHVDGYRLPGALKILKGVDQQ